MNLRYRPELVVLLGLVGCHGGPLKRPLADTGVLDTAALDIAPPGLTVLASGQRLPAALAVDGSNVYWISLGKSRGSRKDLSGYDDGQVNKCAVVGCDGSPTVLASGRSQGLGAFALATNGVDVYWGDTGATAARTDEGAPRGIWRCATSGCAEAPTLVAASIPQGLALSSAKVYWTEQNDGVFACPLSGCEGQPESIWLPQNPAIALYGLAADDSGVFWRTTGENLFMKCSLAGCHGTPAVVMSTPKIAGLFYSFALDATNITFVGVTRGIEGLYACAKTGCGEHPIQLVSDVGAPIAMASDSVNIYWTTGESAPLAGDGMVMKFAVSGANQPIVIASGLNAPGALALDVTSVYWAEPGTGADDGRIVRAPK